MMDAELRVVSATLERRHGGRARRCAADGLAAGAPSREAYRIKY